MESACTRRTLCWAWSRNSTSGRVTAQTCRLASLRRGGGALRQPSSAAPSRATGRDLWAYDTAYRLVRGPYRTGGELAGFGYGKDERQVFAVRKDGRMIGFDAATGRRLQT